MTTDDSINIMHQAVMVAIKLASPLLLVSMAIGLIIAIIQAATQIHEQTITFVPKLFLIGLILLAAGPWMLRTLSDFFMVILDAMIR